MESVIDLNPLGIHAEIGHHGGAKEGDKHYPRATGKAFTEGGTFDLDLEG